MISYLAVWLVFGLAAFLVYQGLRELHPGLLAWGRGGAFAAAAVVAIAGLYELTPLKAGYLRRCRRGDPGPGAQPLAAGLQNGIECVGCSGALMVVLLVLGPMSVTWMIVVAIVLFAEKVPAAGARLVIPVAITLIGLAAWIAIDPATAPGLTLPM